MNKHSECKRQFIQLSRAWYRDVTLRNSELIDEIMIGFYHPGGGTTGEFAIRWVELGGSPAGMLCSFDDSWSALWEFRDLLERLSGLDGLNPSPGEIVKLLEELGVEDATPAKSPHSDKNKERPYSLYSKPRHEPGDTE